MATLEEIKKDIEENRVILFMKGSQLMPMCGFSGRVVEMLQEHGIDFATRDVLQDDDLRSNIKTFSDWPTLPQLYVDGNFIGGCDIVTELHASGDLATLLKNE